jgi:Transglutaminase-like superfamily
VTSAVVVPIRGTRLGVGEKTQLAREIVGLYVLTRRLLRRLSLPEVVADLRGGPPPQSEDCLEADLVVAHRLRRIVGRTLGALPADSRCLVRSLVLAALLARRGIFATVVIGVRFDPSFDAHAWVELNSIPLTRDGELFQRLLEL